MLLQMALFCSFLWTSIISLYMCTSSLSIPPVNGPLSYFHVLATINRASLNIGVHKCFQIIVFSEYMARNGVAGSYGSSIFHFVRNLHTVLPSGCTNLYFYQQCRRVLFSLYPQACIVCRFLMVILTGVKKYIIVVLIWISLNN